MSSKTVITLVVVFLAVFIVFGAITNIIIFNTNFKGGSLKNRFKGEYFEVDDNKSVDLSGVDMVSIDVISSDITVFESKKDMDISLKIKGMSTAKGVKLVVEEKGSTVYIKIKHPKNVFNINIARSKMLFIITDNIFSFIYW